MVGVDLDSSPSREIMMEIRKLISRSTIPSVVVGGSFPLQVPLSMEWVGEELGLHLFREIMTEMERPTWPFTRAAMAAGGSSTPPMEVTMAWVGVETRPMYL
jgi:hypothetical protein